MNYELINEFRKQMEFSEEKTFFEVYENYLNKVQTPYHKSTLEDNLVSFFLSKENQDTILDSFDSLDCAFCLFCTYFDFCSIREFDAFFSGALLLDEIRVRLENLKKRFILLEDSSKGSYEINRLMKARILDEKCSLPDLLDYGYSRSFLPQTEEFLSWPDDGFISSSYVLAAASIYSKSKKTVAALIKSLCQSKIFPLLPARQKPVIIHDLLELLVLVSRARPNTDGQKGVDRRIDENQLEDLLQWSPLQLCVYLASSHDPEPCNVLLDCLTIFQTVRELPLFQFQALVKLQMVRQGMEDKEVSPWDYVKALLTYNVLQMDGKLAVRANSALFEYEKQTRSEFIEAGNTEYNFYGDPKPGDAKIAFLSEIQSLDHMATYQISYEGFKLLTELSADPLEIFKFFRKGSISSTLGRYQGEMERYTISEGILIEFKDPNLSTTMGNLDVIQPYIIRKVSPNAFLLSRKHKDQWLSILQQFIDLDLKLSNLSYEKEFDHHSFPFPGRENGNLKVLNSAPVGMKDKEAKAQLLGKIVDKSVFKPQLFRDIEEKLVISPKQFSKYLTTDALTSKRERPDIMANITKIRKIISSKSQRAMIKTGGKTLIVQMLELTRGASEDSEIRLLEFPSMKESTIPVKVLQSVTVL